MSCGPSWSTRANKPPVTLHYRNGDGFEIRFPIPITGQTFLSHSDSSINSNNLLSSNTTPWSLARFPCSISSGLGSDGKPNRNYRWHLGAVPPATRTQKIRPASAPLAVALPTSAMGGTFSPNPGFGLSWIGGRNVGERKGNGDQPEPKRRPPWAQLRQ